MDTPKYWTFGFPEVSLAEDGEEPGTGARWAQSEDTCWGKLAHDERLAELEHIAYSLGAKHCTIDIVETEKTLKKSNKRFGFNAKANIQSDASSDNIESDVSAEINTNYEATLKKEDTRYCELFWDGSDKPKKPRLKWFAYDDGIKNLIEMRCKGGNKVNARTLKIHGSSSITMSKDTACKIDIVLSSIGSTEGKVNSKRNAQLASQVTKETDQTFIFTIEF